MACWDGAARGYFGPWVMVFFISHYQSKRDQHHKDRFEAVVKMYESNVELVQTTQGLAKDLKDVVILNTSEWQGTRTDVKNNQFCPMVRLKKEAKGVQG